MKKSMERMMTVVAAAFALIITAASCEILDNDPDKHVGAEDSTYVGLEEVAELLALIPLKSSHVNEVHDAVTSSSDNGYDEEYTMKNLFENPGSGVGDLEVRSGNAYENPLRDLIRDHVYGMAATRSGADGIDPDRFLEELMSSDIQIYWPFSDSWDGDGMPIITYDPEDGSDKNMGYRLVVNDDGSRSVESLVVDEALAEAEPVWVVNRNSDAGYATLEMLRREDPEWGEGGGAIIVKPAMSGKSGTKSGDAVRTLILKDFTMKRNYDSWFAGASEFFVKTGYLDNFTASTEAEMRLYSPMVTDFMIVVKRSQVGIPQPFNAILMTDWTDQVESCAFMITEDDGGTQTDWTAKTKVYVAGKSYGVEVTLPLNVRDDIVWRGQLMGSWIEKYSDVRTPFGDVDLTFEVVEYD